MARLFSSYSTKLTSLFLILSLFPVIGISSFLYSEETGEAMGYLKISLLTQSENNADLISEWLTERKNDVINTASNKILVSKTNILVNSNAPDRELYHANFDLQTQATILRENNPWLLEYVLSDQNGKVLFSTEVRTSKEDLPSQNHFKDALAGKLGVSDIYQSRDIIKNENGSYEQFTPTMWISYPIKGDVGINGVFSARVDVFQIPKAIDKKTDYDSLDVYLVNSNGYFISKPRFSNLNDETKRPELEVLVRDPNSYDFTQIFQMVNKDSTRWNLDGYNNYVGKMVVGSITPVKNTNWYVITEINKNEAYSKVFVLQIFLFDIISLSVLTIIGVSIYLSSRLIEPIRKLKQATEIVSKGDFNIKLEPKGDDEFAFLFESFNSMTRSLKGAIVQISLAEMKYRQLYNGAPDLYRTTNTSGVILDCNIAYAKSLGYKKEEVIGKSIFDHTDTNSRDILHNAFIDWKKEGHVAGREIWMKRRDGSIFPTILNATSLYDAEGRLVGSNTSIRDITELYDTKKEIEESRRVIKKQLEELKQVDIAKDEFLMMITHELRTPLVPIKAYVEMLLSQKLGPLSQTQKEKLEIIKSSSESMLKLIKDLLDVQKIELGQLRLVKNMYDVSEIIKDTVVKMKPAADRCGISITCELQENVLCLCDKSRIEQVLVNLISNSLDFSPKQTGKVQIKLSKKDDQATIIVKDNGIGIVKQSIDKIFVKFYQVDTSSTREHGGTGLGLSVCKGIIENHGGKIWAQSEGKGKGMEIHILLPINNVNDAN